jgi:Ca2+-binding EF-hand superfamily protein
MTPNLLTQDSRENINRIFALFDDEKTGFISIKSLRRAVNDLGLDYQEADLLEMVKRADEDGDGFISQEEFYRLISQYGV